MYKITLFALALALTSTVAQAHPAHEAAPASAVPATDFVITIKDHKFSPEELTIPANEKVKIIVKNQDATAEEFESHDLAREKVVSGNSEITILLGPLKPGSYKYFGEFHEDTAKGIITAK